MSTYNLIGSSDNLRGESVVIASGASGAQAAVTFGEALAGILMPTGWDTANIGLEVSLDGVNFYTAKSAGSYMQSVSPAASTFIPFPFGDAVFAPMIKVKSVDVDNVAVTQSAARTLVLMFRRFLS